MTLPGIESGHGLSSEQAAETIRTFGYNELPEKKKNSLFDIVLEVVGEPMFCVLVAT